MTPAESVVAVVGFGGVVTAVRWSPDGDHLVAASADSSVRVVHARPGRNFGGVVWAPRGVATSFRAGRGRRRVRRQVWRGSTENVSSGVCAVDWAPDGSQIAIAAADTIFAYRGDVGGDVGALVAKVNAPSLRYDVRYSPDSTRLCYAVSARRGAPTVFFFARIRPPQVRRGPVSKADRDKQQSSPRKRRNSRGTNDVDPKRSPTKGDLKGLWPVVFVDAPSEKKKEDHRRASFQRD